MATSRGAWKARERKVAAYFGSQRTPLSGGNSKMTRSDSLHDTLFIENKLREHHSAVTLWDETKKLADNEKKTPVVCLCEKGRPDFWVLVKSTDLEKVAAIVKDAREHRASAAQGVICRTCAIEKGLVPAYAEHVYTVHMATCPHCNQLAPVSSIMDWKEPREEADPAAWD